MVREVSYLYKTDNSHWCINLIYVVALDNEDALKKAKVKAWDVYGHIAVDLWVN